MQKKTKNGFSKRRKIQKPSQKNAKKYKHRVQKTQKHTKTGFRKRKKIQKPGSKNVYSLFFLLFALPYIFSFAQLCPPMFFQLLPGPMVDLGSRFSYFYCILCRVYSKLPCSSCCFPLFSNEKAIKPIAFQLFRFFIAVARKLGFY